MKTYEKVRLIAAWYRKGDKKILYVIDVKDNEHVEEVNDSEEVLYAEISVWRKVKLHSDRRESVNK